MHQVLQHDAVDPGVAVGAQARERLVERPGDADRRELAEGRAASEPSPGGDALGAPLEVGGIGADQPRHHDRERERGRVPARVLPGLLADRTPLGALGGRRVDRVVLVGVLRGEPCRTGPGGAADDQRGVRALHRLGAGVERAQPVVPALERERPSAHAPRTTASCSSSISMRTPSGGKLEAVGLVLALVPAGADPELDAAVRDVIHGGGVLGQHRRMAERRGRDEHAEPEARRDRGQAGQRGPGLERAALLVPVDREVVVRAEERAHAVLLAGLRERDPLRPRHVLLALDHQLEPHWRVPCW